MLKRFFDIVVSFLVILIALPFWLVVAIAIKLDSPGSVFYRGIRIGKDGKSFKIYKFRTMVSDAFNRGPGITRKSDTRITRVGRALRKLKIDETPQFINVLKGEMTIVGPRPEDPRYVDYNNPLHDKVLKVLPGITSPASIVYRNEEWLLNGEDWESYYLEKILPCKLAIDIEYLKNRSFKGDLILLFKTFMAMFK